MSKTPTAIIYDFDGTLAPGNMQEHSFIPSLGLEIQSFWRKVEQIAERDNVDGILVYMHLMVEMLQEQKQCLSRELLRENARNIEFFPGVLEWFDTINAYREDVDVQHYIISSGLREMIYGTKIAHHFKEVFASDFIYNEEGNVVAPGLAVNYTNKTQFLFRINKDTPQVYDTHTVNVSLPDEEKAMPFKNMIYIGDGETDVPCIKVVRAEGGHSIAVYDPEKPQAKEVVEQLLADKRVIHGTPADFSEGGRLMTVVKQMIDVICEKQNLYRLRGM